MIAAILGVPALADLGLQVGACRPRYRCEVASVRSDVLNIAYLEMGDRSAPAVILVHGWPDAARGWWEIAEALDKSGWRVIVPDNRGTGTTTFLSSITLRDGSAVALVQDTLDLADSLGL